MMRDVLIYLGLLLLGFGVGLPIGKYQSAPPLVHVDADGNFHVDRPVDTVGMGVIRCSGEGFLVDNWDLTHRSVPGFSPIKVDISGCKYLPEDDPQVSK